MKEIYEGYEVSLNKLSGKFNISLNGDELVTRDTWDAAVKYIDRQLNLPANKPKFTPIEATHLSSWNGGAGKITSIADNKHVWFVSAAGARSKQRAADIVVHTPETLKALTEITNLQVAVEATHKRINAIKNSLPRFKPDAEEGE